MYTVRCGILFKGCAINFSVRRSCVRKMLYLDEIYPGGFYVNNVSVQNKQKKPDFHPNVCVPVQSKTNELH